MKTLILLIATLTLEAQQTPAPAKAEQSAMQKAGTPVVIPDRGVDLSEKPVFTDKQHRAIRDAQVPAMKAAAEFQAYVQRLQQLPDYIRLKSAADASNQKLEAVAGEAMKALGCGDCQLDGETLALTRPQLAAKAEEKPK